MEKEEEKENENHLKEINNENEKDFSFDSENSTIFEDDLENEIITNNSNLILSISNYIEKLLRGKTINSNFNTSLMNIFYSEIIPEISIIDYLKRIIYFSNCEINSLISSLIYINELIKDFPINKHYIHKLLFTCILFSIKYNEDLIYKNDFYCQIAGISLKDLNLMEYNFIVLLNFNFYINPQIYHYYKLKLEEDFSCKSS